VAYTKTETETWQKVFDVLSPLHQKYACAEYLQAVHEMKQECGFTRSHIPQIQDINNYLSHKTGFRLIPIAGLLSGRDFLNYLAFRVFASTQYIRHHSVPFYTPEPDIIHEFIGHAPLFANKDFADFSQQIGLASLGAADDEITKLATCYWFSVEFGLIKDKNQEKKVYGAGVLSSVDEILNAVSDKPEFRFFDPFKACTVEYPITKLQPIYFWSNSFEEAKEMMNKYASRVDRGFTVSYDKEKHEIKVFQDIERQKKSALDARSN
jgi:phenylalanine-4-hydroxylase